MTVLKSIKLTFFSLFFLFSINSFAQLSKTHYIPPICTLNTNASSPQLQYLYVSTPSQEEFDVTITPIGGIPETFQVSNSNPKDFLIGNGAETNLIATSQSIGQIIDDRGFIINGEDLIYVSVKLLASSDNYQGAGLVSKGLPALGETFRVGTFQNESTDVDDVNQFGNPSINMLNFVSVLATQNNTIVNFSDFGNGVTIVNDAEISNIELNAGESYVIGIIPTVVYR